MPDKVFHVAKNLKYGRYKRGLASEDCSIFDEKTSSGIVINENISNQELSNY